MDNKTLLEINVTPEMEKALTEQIRVLPKTATEIVRQGIENPNINPAAAVFGLVACCIDASVLRATGRKPSPVLKKR
jgi:hypothetical protein